MHEETNHYYDEELENKYSFHLKMAHMVGIKFRHLLVPKLNFTAHEVNPWHYIVSPAIWGHDLLEDTRQNYNSILKRSNSFVAEICRAVTNYGRGRNREERMPDWIYQEIVDTPYAVFVKLCDRIANVRYSQMMESRMLQVYRMEQPHFKQMLRDDLSLEPMWEALDKLLA